MFHQAWAIDKQECKMIKTDSLITHIPKKRLVAHMIETLIFFPAAHSSHFLFQYS